MAPRLVNVNLAARLAKPPAKPMSHYAENEEGKAPPSALNKPPHIRVREGHGDPGDEQPEPPAKKITLAAVK